MEDDASGSLLVVGRDTGALELGAVVVAIPCQQWDLSRSVFMRTNEPVTIRRQDYLPYPFALPRTQLKFELSPGATRVSATLHLERRAPGPLVLEGIDLALQSIRLDDEPLSSDRYALCANGLTIADVPDRFTLATVVTIDPDGNTALEGLYRSSGTFCTQCEAEGFRKITYAPDRPDVLSVYDVEIVADASLAPVLLANGNLISTRTLDDGRSLAHWHDPHPKPSYLFALVAGDLTEIGDRFVSASGREVQLSIFVEAHNASRCDFAMASLKHAMAWDESVYGFEYDLDRYMIVAVDDFNMGAMENKGLNVFNSKFVLADTDTATDTDFLWIEAVIAHEYFHNWTGNRITCRDWFQLSLKEGLTVFRDQCFTAERHSAPVKRIKDVQRLRAAQFPEDAGPLAHPIRPDSYVQINNFYTATVYEKGAEVVRMLHTLLGERAFFSGIRTYVLRHDGKAATCEDFVAAMESASGADLSQFRLWYATAGTPRIEASEHWDAAHGRLTLTLRQSCPDTPGQNDKAPMHLPIAIGLLGRHGGDLLDVATPGADAPVGTPGTRVLALVDREQTFTLDALPERPVVSWLRGFSAPVRLEVDRDVVTLGFLAAHDSDAFSRWEAGQQLAHRAIDERIDGGPAAGGGDAERALVAMAGAVLADGASDPALAAEMLRLPGVEVIGDDRFDRSGQPIDVAAIDAAREGVMRAIATAHRDALRELVAAASTETERTFGGMASGRRSLRGAALGLLVALEEALWTESAQMLYANAGTMTDRVAALAALCDASGPVREHALVDFRERFDGNALVIDKWFALQAMSRRPDTLESVRQLAGRDDFDAGNPNRLRALIAGFAMNNPLRFHAPDGGGHRFVADFVIALDRSNPQVAARLVAPLGRWQRHVAPVGDSLRHELERILAEGARSPDVVELVSRSLESGARPA